MKKYIVIIPAIVILLFTGFRCGGSSSDSDTTVVSLSFERIDSAGLDPFKVTVTVRTNNTPVTGAVLERTVPKGTVSAITDNGDGTYSFTVIPAETGEYPVTVSYNGSSVTRTALVLLSVHSDWGQPMAVPGNYVNTEGYEDGVTISPDGEYLFVQYGPHYFSGILLSLLHCGGLLTNAPCNTHVWTNCTKGPVSSPERPGFWA
ncbi:MAG TPA: Ig-like domain-containing protein [Spirochaetota bacterium]|nr:Ig-like domain-containing protein [Spirochaetota bacterium]